MRHHSAALTEGQGHQGGGLSMRRRLSLTIVRCSIVGAVIAAVMACEGMPSTTKPIDNCSRGSTVPAAADDGLLADCNTLLSARDMLAGRGSLNWASDVDINEWEGVFLGGTPERLVRLELEAKGLSGSIPPQLGQLEKLEWLRLSENQLSGSIPAELGTLQNLRELILPMNNLSGQIPPELGRLGNLRWLSLWENQLTGTIPSELGQLSNLVGLHASQNSLMGSIPAELGDLANLESLGLWGNELSGQIPPELGKLGSN